MTPAKTFSILFAFIVLLLIASSIYTVQQGQAGMISRLGKIREVTPNEPKIFGPGLHFKMPFVDQLLTFDTRIQTNVAKSSRMYIENDTYFQVDYYVKWRIVNLAKFYTSVSGKISNAESLMENKINNSMRADFKSRSLTDIVALDREDIMQRLRSEVSDSVKDLGIEIVDLRLTSLDLPDAVKKALFQSMIARWETVANKNRADGERQAAEIRAEADGERIQIIATAQREVKELQAFGLAKASEIYADAFQKDPQFYSFYRSMTAYQDIFDNAKNMLILSPDGDFFKYFNNINGSLKAEAPSKKHSGA
ncbi:MAG: protease modulator HflC [Legionellales bacterium]|nr:protease modulator HflC [Legionellales bacterium]